MGTIGRGHARSPRPPRGIDGRRRMTRLDLKVPPDVGALLAAAGVWVLSRVVPVPAVPAPYGTIVGVFLLVAGVVVVVAARIALARAHTTFSPIAPQRSATLVTDGVYGFSRNPMYLGMVLVLLGVAGLFGSFAGLVPVAAFAVYIDCFQIAPEERALRAKFGSAYEAYRAKTRRWF